MSTALGIIMLMLSRPEFVPVMIGASFRLQLIRNILPGLNESAPPEWCLCNFPSKISSEEPSGTFLLNGLVMVSNK